MMFEDREAYSTAESAAADEIAVLDPLAAASERAVAFDPARGTFTVPLLGRDVEISFPSARVARPGGDRLTGAAAVVALHYLYYHGEPLRSPDWLAYRDMPGGRDFSRAFDSMAESRLGLALGSRPEAFRAAAAALAGVKAPLTDLSFVVPALPRVPVMVVLWPECEEAPGAARILFRPSAPYYLHTEDLAALGILCAERMISIAG